jgi:hypothetical protein
MLCQEWASRHSCTRRAWEQTLEILQGVQKEARVPPRVPPHLLPTRVGGWALDKGG